MFAIMLIAAAFLAVLTAAVGLLGIARQRARAAETHNHLRRAGQHPAPAAYDPGAGYTSTAGVTGGGDI